MYIAGGTFEAVERIHKPWIALRHPGVPSALIALIRVTVTVSVTSERGLAESSSSILIFPGFTAHNEVIMSSQL